MMLLHTLQEKPEMQNIVESWPSNAAFHLLWVISVPKPCILAVPNTGQLLAKGSSYECLLQPIPRAHLLSSFVFSYLIWGSILLPRMPWRNPGWLQRRPSPWPFWLETLAVFLWVHKWNLLCYCYHPGVFTTHWHSVKQLSDTVCAAGTTQGPLPQDWCHGHCTRDVWSRVAPHSWVDTAKGCRKIKCALNNLDAEHFHFTDAPALAWGSEDSWVPAKLFKW